jgi:integrase
MPTGRITKTVVEDITPPAKDSGQRVYLWDDKLKGFGVMVTEAGTRCYIVQYKIGGRAGRTRRVSIGHHGNPWTAERARSYAADVLEDIRKGIDPVEAEKARRAEQAAQRIAALKLAFTDYADTFISKHAERGGLRSVDDIKSVFRRDLKPEFLSTPISTITRADIRDCLDRIGERSGSAANKAHKWLRKMFGWAVDRGDLAVSPMQGMPPPHIDGKRGRTLNSRELRLVWKASEDKLIPQFTALVKLLILTGQRLREVAGMKWEEVRLDAATWIIPGARTKNKRDHLVPLNDQAVDLLEALQPDKKARKGLVLTTTGETPISGFSRAKASLDSGVADLVAKAAALEGGDAEPVESWVFHDLRRTVATGCQALGIPVEHTEALLNHVSGKRGGIVGIYQLHDYRDEKARAAAAWGRHMAHILASDGTASNVTPIEAARGRA